MLRSENAELNTSGMCELRPMGGPNAFPNRVLFSINSASLVLKRQLAHATFIYRNLPKSNY